MGIFDGHTEEASASFDAAIEAAYNEAAGDQGERQEADQTQAEAEPNGPEQEDAAPAPQEAPAEVAPPEGEPAKEPVTKSEPDIDWQKRYQESQARMNRACMDAAKYKRELQTLEQRLQQQEEVQKQLQADPGYKERMLQTFVDNPEGTIEQLVERKAESLVQQKLRETLSPVLEAAQRGSQEKAWQEAMGEAVDTWPELKERSKQEQLVEQMQLRASQMGDPSLWQRHPRELIKLTAMDIYGLPKTINQEAVLAAAETARQQALQEANQKNAAKAGLDVGTNARQPDNKPKSPQDQIIEAMMNAGSGRLF